MSGSPADPTAPATPGIALSPLPGRVGEVLVAPGTISRARGGAPVRVQVHNTSAWPVVITSHFHFFEANRWLQFDRAAAFGRHLDVVAGGSARFEPGETAAVALVDYAGDRSVHGFNGLCDAVLSADPATFEQQRTEAVARARALGYLDMHPETGD